MDPSTTLPYPTPPLGGGPRGQNLPYTFPILVYLTLPLFTQPYPTLYPIPYPIPYPTPYPSLLYPIPYPSLHYLPFLTLSYHVCDQASGSRATLSCDSSYFFCGQCCLVYVKVNLFKLMLVIVT